MTRDYEGEAGVLPWIGRVFQIEPGEFMHMQAGSRHLLLAVVLGFAREKSGRVLPPFPAALQQAGSGD
ncbi:hypothetical protein [Microbulbifer elongatus]|uniref:hypothetical protein n=1 Tax=Microbulbifer elongatus TaxID=86173 RepID=UPI001E4559B2|nr:hypothetical protein [Microbulbifer elongatus]